MGIGRKNNWDSNVFYGTHQLKIAPLGRTVTVQLVGGRDASYLDDHNWVRGGRDREILLSRQQIRAQGFHLDGRARGALP
jgi:hypothetical protein